MNREELSQAVLDALEKSASPDSDHNAQEILQDCQAHSPDPRLRRTPSCPLPLSLPDLDHFDVDTDNLSSSPRRPSLGSLRSADLIDFKRPQRWEGTKSNHKSEPSTPLLDMSFAQAQSTLPASPDASVFGEEVLAANLKAPVEEATGAQLKRTPKGFQSRIAVNDLRKYVSLHSSTYFSSILYYSIHIFYSKYYKVLQQRSRFPSNARLRSASSRDAYQLEPFSDTMAFIHEEEKKYAKAEACTAADYKVKLKELGSVVKALRTKAENMNANRRFFARSQDALGWTQPKQLKCKH